MKNKTIFLFLTTIFPMLFLTCQKAELPTIGRALLTIQAEATKNQISMSAEIESSGDLEIYERGFIYNYPIYKDGHWRREEAKYIVEKQKSFEKHLNDIDYQKGMYCEIYAYISTNYGIFKSETKRIDIDDRPEPIITSIIQDPISKTMVIKGTGFSSHKDWIQLWIMDQDKKYNFNIIKSSFTEIEVDYNYLYLQDYNYLYLKHIGKYKIYLKVDNIECSSEAYFEIKGSYLERIEPNRFKLGEEISLFIKDFKATDNFTIDVGGYGDAKVTSIHNNIIKVRISTTSDELKLRLYDKDGYYSELPVSIYEPWEQTDCLDYKKEVIGCHHGILYLFSKEEFTLYAYNPTTKEMKPYDLKSIVKETDVYAINYFGTDNYIYLILQYHIWNYQQGKSEYKQNVFRLHLSNSTWEQLSDVHNQPNSKLIINPIFVFDKQTAYASYSQIQNIGFYKYNLDTDCWEDTNITYDTYYVPELIGTYNNDVFYKKDYNIYRVNTINPQNTESIFESLFNWSSLPIFSLQNKYLYFKDGNGLFRLDVSSTPIKCEALGGRDFTGTFIPTKSGLYFCWDNKIYRYTDELKMD